MKVIHIFRASGAGASTLGEAISNKYGTRHMDIIFGYQQIVRLLKKERFEKKRSYGKRYKSFEVTGSPSCWGVVLCRSLIW